MSNRKFISGIIKFALTAVLTLVVFSIRLSMLKKSEMPNGLDGYYYVLQAESFVTHLELENPDPECGYYLSGFVSGVCGDSILGVKIWSAISSALFSLSVFVLIFVLIEKSSLRFLFSLVGLLFSAASVCTTAMSLNYINNQTGLFFLLFYAASLVSLFKKKDSVKAVIGKGFLALVLLVLTIFSHKVSAVYGILFTVFYIISKILSGKLSSRNALSVIVCIFLLFGIVFVIAINQSPRFNQSFGFPSFPFLHQKIIDSMGTKGLAGSIEITVCSVLAFAMTVALVLFRKKIGVECFFVAIIFFPFWNLDSDMGFRMSLNGMLVGIPLLVYLAVSLLDFTKIWTSIKTVSLLGLCIVFFVAMFFTPKVYDPRLDPPFEYYKKVAEKIQLEDDTLLIAHLGLNHVYTYYNNLRDCMNWLPNYDIDENKIWRLAYGADSRRIVEVLVADYVKNLPEEDADRGDLLGDVEAERLFKEITQVDKNYVLLQESIWQKYLSDEEPEIAETFNNWYNPSEVRPEYIRRTEKKKAAEPVEQELENNETAAEENVEQEEKTDGTEKTETDAPKKSE